MKIKVVEAEACQVVARADRGRLERYRSSLGELDVVHVVGDRQEMGRQYGTFVGERIQRILNRTLEFFAIMGVPAEAGPLILLKAWERMKPHVRHEYLSEMDAIAEGATRAGSKLTAVDVALATAATNLDLYKAEERFVELLGPDIPSIEPPFDGKPPMSCTMLAVWGSRTVDGKLYAHRNLDWWSQTGMHAERLVTVYHPDEGQPFVTIGYAGVMGALAGMNAHGITLSEVGAFSMAEELDGTPWTLTARRVLERATSLDEGVDVVRGAKHTLGYNYLIADGNPDGFGTSAYRPGAAAIETNHRCCEVFGQNDPKEAQACWTAPDGTAIPYGLPLPEAIMRADTAFGKQTRALQATDNGPGEPANTGDPRAEGSTYVTCHRPMHDMVVAYERGNEYVFPVRRTKVIEAGEPRKIGPAEMLTIAATVAHNTEKLDVNDWNVMSVVYGATDREFWVAYEAQDEKGNWTNAPDSGYWHFDLESLLDESP
ncbi:MAG: hypothetical protein JXQ73_12595 [Phycisphaerae bacterium]|nr:hypothetical protein [Phycisphaerae bacterium]